MEVRKVAIGWMGWVRARAVISVVAVVGTLGILAGPAVATTTPTPEIYWTNWANVTGTTLGAAALSAPSTTTNQSYITGATIPNAVAVDGQYMYWVNNAVGTPSIGRASLSSPSTTTDQTFISPTSTRQWGGGIAVSDRYIYWSSGSDSSDGWIGRANLNGTGVNNDFIQIPGGDPQGIAVNGRHIYWANVNSTTIGRANLNGTGVNNNFITSLSTPQTVAVNGQHIYWTNGGTIGRANLDGTAVNDSFITGASTPLSLAVDSSHIYWSNTGSTTIGRANLDGSSVNQSFVTGASNPWGVAVSVPHLSVTPAGLSAFPSTAVGSQSASQTLTVTNSGQQNLTIAPALSGAGSGDFKITANNCPASISPGANCQLTVAFAPVTSGTLSANLSLTSNDYANSPMAIRLAGAATKPTVRVRLVICHTIVRSGVTKRRCVTHHLKVAKLRIISGRSHASLHRHHHLFARGHARHVHGHWNVFLNRRRVMHHGRYKLIIRAKRNGHWITQKRRFKL